MRPVLSELLALIEGAQKRVPLSRPVIVGIDGQSAAGKSTLARLIQESLQNVAVVHKDDFYSSAPAETLAGLTASEGYQRFFEWQRLEEQVLQPLSSGKVAKYQRYDWSTSSLGKWCCIPASSRVVIIEGVYSLRPELRKFYDVMVLVNTDPALRDSRIRARGENSTAWIQRWSDSEAYYFERVFDLEEVLTIGGNVRDHGL